MPDRREWREYVRTHPAATAPAMRPERVADLTTKSQMVVAHPGWQMFLDRLASRRALLSAQRAAVERQILDGEATDDRTLHLRLREVTGELRGLDFATTIIPEMLANGETMLRNLTTGVTVADAAR